MRVRSARLDLVDPEVKSCYIVLPVENGAAVLDSPVIDDGDKDLFYASGYVATALVALAVIAVILTKPGKGRGA